MGGGQTKFKCKSDHDHDTFEEANKCDKLNYESTFNFKSPSKDIKVVTNKKLESDHVEINNPDGQDTAPTRQDYATVNLMRRVLASPPGGGRYTQVLEEGTVGEAIPYKQ